MTRRIAAAFAGLFALAGCAGVEGADLRPAPDAKVDGTFEFRRQDWTTGDEFHYWMRAYDVDGQLTVCGATVVKTGSSPLKNMLIERVLDDAKVRLGSKTLMYGLRENFYVTRDKALPRPKRAKCTATGLPYPKDGPLPLNVAPPRHVTVGS